MFEIIKGRIRQALMLTILTFWSGLLIACGDTTPTQAPVNPTVVTGTTTTPASAPTTQPASPPSDTTGGNLTLRPGYKVGETRRLGAGLVQSWVKLDENNKPTALGVTFSEAVLTDLPIDPFNQLPLNLPDQAATTAINHLSMDWNPNGHEPAGIYDKPHFDIHFYLISPQERGSILPTGDVAALSKAPSPEFVPPDYIVAPGPPSIVPGQGIHWFDKTSPEFRGQPFTQTFIYGYANARLDFFEPMMTKAYLETKPDFATDLKLPASYPKAGVSYPTRFSIKYDAAAKEYLVSLEGLTMR